MKPGDRTLDPANLGFVEEVFRRSQRTGRPLSEPWRALFEGTSVAARPETVSPPGRSIFAGAPETVRPEDAVLAERVERLARAFTASGHRAARLDPLGTRRPEPPELDPRHHGIERADMERRIPYGSARRSRSVRSIERHLRAAYCGPIGFQLAHLRDGEPKRWLRRRAEEEHVASGRDARVALLERLSDVQVFEEFLRKRFVGSKSYSLEGAESLLLVLDAALFRAGDDGADELVLAMPHRGRLGVLATFVDKPPARIFREIEDDPDRAAGDLRYHLGASTDRRTPAGREVHVSLCFNPSHLESVGPIALGRLRAKQDRSGDRERTRGVAVVVHGDASCAGEGVVQELFNLSGLSAYDTGGILHVVVDNQLGFTTPSDEGRSFEYASDVALVRDVPVLHVNADEPEAVVRATSIAMDFRARFRRDAVVDLVGYRRFGHSEVDEPRFTQPVMYARIDATPPVRERFARELVAAGDVAEERVERMLEPRREALSRAYEARGAGRTSGALHPTGVWAGFRGGPVAERDAPATGVPRARVAEFVDALTRVPAGFHAHDKVERLLEKRREMAAGERPLDWATAEALALASLAAEGTPVRMSGQDTARGTFSQRHAQLFDQETGDVYEPFAHLAPGQARVEIGNSPLSELGALGFEYGYSLDRPGALVLWEAQFGDFANGAQVVIDQFVASAEDKWRRLSAIVLLLPHGYEGQGPEHSSARLERFLQGAAEDNWQVVQPSTPAQYFHLLRRQALQRWKKPLIVLTPKSLLRHPRCVSSLADLERTSFQSVLPDDEVDAGAERVLLCSGKLWYELTEAREERGHDDVAIVRVEDLYPFPEEGLGKALEPYADGTPALWVQEEPENMGAWRWLAARFPTHVGGRLPFRGVTRAASPSPAGGSAARHREAQEELVARAFEERS